MGKDNVIKIVAGTALIVGSIFVPGGALISGLLMSGGLGLVQGGVVGALRGDLPDRQTARMANPISEQADGSVIYGLYRVGGQIVEIRRHPTDEKVVYVVITICVGTQAGSGIEDVTKVYFDDRLAISDPDTSGALSTTGLSGTFDEHVQYAIHLGTNAQSVDAELTARFPAQWPSSSKGAGIAYAVLRLTYDGDVFPTGLPQITFEVKGQKLFDPRSSSTVWSANPALVIRDYLTSTKYGCAMTEAEIDDTTIIDAANYCDEVINTTAYNGPRFTCNGAAETGRPRRDNLAELLSACRGELVHQAGKFRLIVRRPTVATSFQLTEDNIVGDWEFVRAGADAPNSVTAAYVDPAREYQVREITWPDAGQSNGFLSADNGIAAHTRVELPFTTDYYIAQQIGMVALREAREDVTIAVTAKESALFLQPGDVVPVTHSTPGFSSKHFWVAALGILPDATVRLVLREYDANAYTLDTQNTEATVPGTDLPNPFFCEPPSDLELQSSSFTALATQEGQFLPRIRATWTASPDPFLSGYEIQYKESTASAWTAWIPHDRLATEAMIAPVTDRLQYDVRVRAVNTIGVHSAWVQDSVAASTRYVRPTSSTFGVVSTSSVPDVLVSLRGFANGDVRLSVTRADVGAAKGFAYKYSKNVPLNPLPTDSGVVQQNFLFADAESAVTFSSSDQLAEGQTAYVYVWPIGWPPGPISGAGPNGSIGRRIDVRWTRPVASVDTPHLAVDFDHHGMVPGMVAIRVDISDPANRGGTFRAWTAPTAVTSPNPAGSPDAEIAITSTPAYVRSQLPGTVSSAYIVPALAFPVGDGITKTCYVEFLPTGGTTSGKIPFEVTTPVLSAGNPNTHLDPRIRVGIAGAGPS
ncbi:MAG: phage tail protein, partial [Longimicrobiales bacterium]